MEKIIEMERRTLILRKVPPTTTAITILKDLQRQFNRPLADTIEAVVREPLDRRRFYVRFNSMDVKRECARQGFTIGDIQIPPQRSDIQGLIPDVPHYLDREDMVSILSRFGEVIKGEFDCFEDTNVRCGVFRFEMNLHPNHRLPSNLQILSDSFHIHCKDDLMQCGYCDKYGHRAIHCMRKKEDLERKAEKELAAQINNNLLTTDVAMDQGDADQAADTVLPTIISSSPQTQQANTPQVHSVVASNTPTTQFLPTQVLHSVMTASTSSTPVPTQHAQPPTQEVTFVSGGNLDTLTKESYPTPVQTNQLNTEDTVF